MTELREQIGKQLYEDWDDPHKKHLPWANLTPEHQEEWRQFADPYISLLTSLGVVIKAEDQTSWPVKEFPWVIRSPLQWQNAGFVRVLPLESGKK